MPRAPAPFTATLLPLLIPLLAVRVCTAGSSHGVPENITVTFLNPTTVRVSWSTAADNIDKYDVTYKPTDASYRVVAVVAGNSDAVTLSGLQADTQYQLTVAAVWAGHKFRSRPIVFRTLEPPRTSPQQEAGALGTGSPVGAPAPSTATNSLNDALPTFPTIRGVEIGIVLLVLVVWIGAIALFFNRWGKIRMLLPYQPDYKQEQLKVPGTGVCAGTTTTSCTGNHGGGPSCPNFAKCCGFEYQDACCLLDRCFAYPRRDARDCGCQFALLHRAEGDPGELCAALAGGRGAALASARGAALASARGGS